MSSERRWTAAFIAGALAFLALTNRWLSWSAGCRLLTARDELDYRTIASAAPGLPKLRIAEQHAQRFPFHWLLGAIAHGLGVGVESLYTVAVVAIAVVLCGLLAALLSHARLSRPASAVCLGVFVLNPYSLRYYGLAPGEFGDLLFDAGILLVLLGLLRGRYALVLGGLALATLARQSALPATFAVVWWLARGPGWRESVAATRAGRALGAVLVPALVYFVLVRASASFSYGTTPDLAHFTLLVDLERLPGGAGTLAQHVLRSVNGLFSLAALIGTAAWVGRRRPAILPFEFYGSLAIMGCIAVQPLLFSPGYAAHNETRLAVLSLGPGVCALGYALRALERRGRQTSGRTAALMVGGLALASFHHLYTVIGPASAAQTVILQFVVACALAVALLDAWPIRFGHRA